MLRIPRDNAKTDENKVQQGQKRGNWIRTAQKSHLEDVKGLSRPLYEGIGAVCAGRRAAVEEDVLDGAPEGGVAVHVHLSGSRRRGTMADVVSEQRGALAAVRRLGREEGVLMVAVVSGTIVVVGDGLVSRRRGARGSPEALAEGDADWVGGGHCRVMVSGSREQYVVAAATVVPDAFAGSLLS